jgi:hypothetical protein
MRKAGAQISSGLCSINGKRRLSYLLPVLFIIVALALAAGLTLTLTARVLLAFTTHVALLALPTRALLPFAAHAALAMLFSFSTFATGILFTIRIH